MPAQLRVCQSEKIKYSDLLQRVQQRTMNKSLLCKNIRNKITRDLIFVSYSECERLKHTASKLITQSIVIKQSPSLPTIIEQVANVERRQRVQNESERADRRFLQYLCRGQICSMLQSRVLNFCIYDEASRRDRTIFRCLRVTRKLITLSRVKRILSIWFPPRKTEKEDVREEKQKKKKKEKKEKRRKGLKFTAHMYFWRNVFISLKYICRTIRKTRDRTCIRDKKKKMSNRLYIFFYRSVDVQSGSTDLRIDRNLSISK